MKRLSIAIALSFVFCGGAQVGVAHAAGNPDHASCLGATASAVPPGTKDDVAHLITELAALQGTNHGGLVSGFANGSVRSERTTM